VGGRIAPNTRAFAIIPCLCLHGFTRSWRKSIHNPANTSPRRSPTMCRHPLLVPSKANALADRKPECSSASRVPPDGVGVSVQVTTVQRRGLRPPPPRITEALVQIDLQHLAVHDPVPPRRRLRLEGEPVPDDRPHVIDHDPLREQLELGQRAPYFRGRVWQVILHRNLRFGFWGSFIHLLEQCLKSVEACLSLVSARRFTSAHRALGAARSDSRARISRSEKPIACACLTNRTRRTVLSG
jgi:hypothetical protein